MIRQRTIIAARAFLRRLLGRNAPHSLAVKLDSREAIVLPIGEFLPLLSRAIAFCKPLKYKGLFMMKKDNLRQVELCDGRF
jgi:hypothetical protein